MNEMTNKAASLSIEALKAEIVKTMDCAEDWVGAVLAALLDALEAKMPAAEFVAFCNAA